MSVQANTGAVVRSVVGMKLLGLALLMVGTVAALHGQQPPATPDGTQAELSKVTSVRLLFDESGLPTKFTLKFSFSTTTLTAVGEVEKERTTTTVAEVDLALHGGDRSFAAMIIKPDGKRIEVYCTDIILAQLIKARAEQEYLLRNPKAAPTDALALTPPIIRRTARAPLESKVAPTHP